MNLFSRHNSPQLAIAKTGFITSMISYVVFWIADLIHPGFVSDYFSVHWFLIAAVAFGVWQLALG